MKKPIIFLFTTICVCTLLFFLLDGGNSTERESVLSTEDLNLEDSNDMDFTELKVEILREGSGEESQSGNTLVVNYVGTLKDGTKFDSSYDRGEPFEFTLGQNSVIQGWEQGMVGMKIDEKRKIEIPSSMGYGESGVSSIPGNSGLIFEVELLEIK
jgi:FKBP-type peptidyl-prolyl cis-trans isomerase